MIDSVEFIKCLVNWMNGIEKKDRLGTKLQVSPFPRFIHLIFYYGSFWIDNFDVGTQRFTLELDIKLKPINNGYLKSSFHVLITLNIEFLCKLEYYMSFNIILCCFHHVLC